MIGLGRWTGTIETSMISGSAIVEITDNNGEYAFSVETDSIKTIPNFTVYDIIEKDNTLSGKADIELMGKVLYACKEIAASLPECDSGYRIINNCGKHGAQSVKHIHFHLLGGAQLPEDMGVRK